MPLTISCSIRDTPQVSLNLYMLRYDLGTNHFAVASLATIARFPPAKTLTIMCLLQDKSFLTPTTKPPFRTSEDAEEGCGNER
jgi:hypothetical protein